MRMRFVRLRGAFAAGESSWNGRVWSGVFDAVQKGVASMKRFKTLDVIRATLLSYLL